MTQAQTDLLSTLNYRLIGAGGSYGNWRSTGVEVAARAEIAQLRASGLSDAEIVAGIPLNASDAAYLGLIQSPPPTYTHEQNVDFITNLFATNYHRLPDLPGLNFWVGQLESGSHTRDTATHAFATSPDQSPNSGQTLQAYLSSQSVLPFPGYTFSADGNSIVPASSTTSGTTGTTPTTTTTPSTIPIIGPIIDQVGSVAVGLPLIGPFIQSASTAVGIGPGWIAVGGGLAALYMLGAFEGSRRR